MSLSESFQVAAIIEKLPLFWKDFKNYIEQSETEMGVEDLILRLRIENNKKLFKKSANSFYASKEIIVKQMKQMKNFDKESKEEACCDGEMNSL